MWKEEVKARIPEFDFTLKNQLVEWWLTPSDCLWRVLLRALCKIYNNIKIKFVSSPEVADFRDLVACLSLSTPRLVVKMWAAGTDAQGAGRRGGVGH